MAFGMTAAQTALVVGGGGALMGAMSGGGGSQSGSTTTTNTKDPWSGATPYLLGSSSRTLKSGVNPSYSSQQVWNPNKQNDDGTVGGFDVTQSQTNPDSDYETTNTPGVLPESAKLYGQSQWTPGMQANSDRYSTGVEAQYSSNVNTANNLASDIFKRGYDPKITSAGNISAQQVNPTSAFSSMGAANPTGALGQMLSGQVNNPYLQQQSQALSAQSNQNLMQNVMPQIRSGAQMAGQYGGTRQGIAEGVAAGNAQTGLNANIANLYGNAYQQAQQNMYGTANNLSGLSLQNAAGNANRTLSADQANQNTQLQNNAQQMQLSQQQLNNSLTGVNLGNQAATSMGNWYNTQQGLLQAPSAYNQNALTNYANLVNSAAGQGNVESATEPYFSNTAGNIIGGASAGLKFGNEIGGLLGSRSSGSSGWNSNSYDGTTGGYFASPVAPW